VRIEGGSAQPSHVFGTIHLSDPRVTKLPPAVARDLNEARSLTVEVGLGGPDLFALANHVVFSDGRDPPGAVGPELYGKIGPLVEKPGIPEPVVRLFKPWAVAVLLSVPQQNSEKVLDLVIACSAARRASRSMSWKA
jgi:uncharacterized protein YbaP (TraB family)